MRRTNPQSGPYPGRLHPVLALALALLAALPARAAAVDADPVVAQRGSVALTAGMVRDLLAGLDAEQQQKLRADPKALANFVRDRVLQAALLEEARAHQWDQRPEIAARAEQARNAVLADSYLSSLVLPDPGYPSEQDIQGAYEANKAKLMLPRQYHLAQIFITVPPGAAQTADDEAQTRIAALRQQWLKSKGDPTVLVKKAADDRRPVPVALDLGWVREDQVITAIRPTVGGMAEGDISHPIRMADGWHVVRLSATRPAGPASLADAHDALARALRQARQQQNVRAYLDGLLQRTPIQLNEIELAHIVGK